MAFYPDDLVEDVSNELHMGVVVRTHEDVDSHEPRPGRDEPDPIQRHEDIPKAAFNKFMKDGIPPKGTVFVRWPANPQLIHESKLKAVDRDFLIGDVVKENIHSSMSGIVLNASAKCVLRGMGDFSVIDKTNSRREDKTVSFKALSVSKLEGGQKYLPPQTPPIVDVPASELRYDESPTATDLVIYKDWFGRVEHVTNMIAIRLGDNCVVEIKDGLAHHVDHEFPDFSVGDMASTKKSALRTGRWIFGQYNPNTLPIGTVMQCRPIAIEVTWLERRIGSDVSEREPPSVLERDELESHEFRVYDRTRRPKEGTGSETTSHSDLDIRMGLRVRFKDLSGACVKYNGMINKIDRKDTLGYDLNVFEVTKLQTEVTVQWQDLSISRHRSIDLIPDDTLADENSAWPGEIAHTDLVAVPTIAGLKEAKRIGVIQTVNPSERMATIKWCPEAIVQYSVDVLDSPMANRTIVTRVIGQAGEEQEVLSLYDIEAPGELNVRRGDVVLVASKSTEPSDVDWIGEIVDTNLDGTLTIRLGAAKEVRDVTIRREAVVVALRSDMGDEEIEGWGSEDDVADIRINMDGEIEIMHGPDGGDSEEEDSSDSDSEYDSDEVDSEEDEEKGVTYEDENGMPLDQDEVEDVDWESAEEGDIDDVEMAQPTKQSHPPVDANTSPDVTMADSDPPTDLAPESPSDEPEQYLILDTPVAYSHAFRRKPSTSIPAHMKRTQKEHKILRSPSNLPKGVYVRTWESRLDLFRVLFIGPAETPYDNAPFVVDFYLPPSFPTEPPQAFFHSWPSESGLGAGVGRVNPNLYEDGKICLSLLGTWDSGKAESWSASRSTLLQVLVSLLGLVLVKEPYFNEAGYEPLVGLESSRRASQLYSERVYLKAKTFVIAALVRVGGRDGLWDGVEGLEDVLRWLYKDGKGARLLDKTIGEVEGVLERSMSGEQESDGLTVMSKGACISLERVLKRLKEL